MSVEWFGKQVSALVEKACFGAVDDGVKSVLADAKKYVPVDTGALRDSGRALKTRKMRSGIISGYVRFGGKKAPYAFYAEVNDSYIRRALKTNERMIEDSYKNRLK